MTTIRPRKKTSTRKATRATQRAEERANPKTESLWRHYRRTRSAKTRNQLVERYRGVVEAMASTMAMRLPRSVDVQDLVHAGVWGLMRAIETFEHERGSHFLAFMRIRARGAMLDELRSLDFLPRLARHRRRAVDEAQLRLRESLDREPSDAELADELGITEVAMRRAVAPAAPNGHRRPGGVGEDAIERIEEIVDEGCESPDEALNRQDLLVKIRASLQPIEWRVLELHYLDGLSGKEVARRLELSAARICQIHGRVLSRLKSRLAALR